MKKQISSHAEAAKLIRKELAQAFPLIKFRVVSNSYSGGNSVQAYWIDGPCEDQVEAIINKYQYGHFDGMQDIYEFSNRNNDIPQVKYVFAEREYSHEVKQKAFEIGKARFNGWENLKSYDETSFELKNQWSVWTAWDHLYRYVCKMDLTNGFNEFQEGCL